LEQAFQVYEKPEIFNTGQSYQFTSDVFTSALKQRGITISMDGRGGALDNIFVERLARRCLPKMLRFDCGVVDRIDRIDRIFYILKYGKISLFFEL
tara:strand:+ start:247 stop:534 length:288 start_codon:yes stop_codon:yes gene_type:complete